MVDKAEIYADMIRRLLLQYDGLETGLKTSAKSGAAVQTEEKTASSPAAVREEASAVTEASHVTTNQTVYGLTPTEISDVFERDARRYDGG